MGGGAWWAAVHGVARSRTRLSDFTFTFQFHALEKEMATHSSVLAWRIPGMREPGGLPSMGSHRVRHWSDLAAAAAYGEYGQGWVKMTWEWAPSWSKHIKFYFYFKKWSDLAAAAFPQKATRQGPAPLHVESEPHLTPSSPAPSLQGESWVYVYKGPRRTGRSRRGR